MADSRAADVVVVGAGPTGLLLAGDLAAAGVRVMLLERRTDRPNLTRAFGVHARTMEQLDARGVADDLAATGAHVQQLRLFDGIGVDLSRLPSRYNYVLVSPQYETERLLEQRLERVGSPVVRGVDVTGLTQDDHAVTVHGRSVDGAPVDYHAEYVVGTDGVGSSVRSALGLPFPGRSVIRSIMLADVRLADPPPDVLAVNGVGDAFALVLPFGDGWYRVFAWNRHYQPDDSAPLDLAELRTVTARAFGTDFGMHSPRWMSRFHSDERQVPHYRVGRVFLAGDAAHVHSPAGAQGMNTGLQDAANLSWKLAAAVQRWGPADVLDSYHAERHPVGAAVLRSSGTIMRMALLDSPWRRRLRNGLGSVLSRIPPIVHRFAGLVSGIAIHYDRPNGAHELVGRRAPDVALTHGRRLYEALRVGRFVLLTPYPPTEWSRRVELGTAAEPGSPSMLVRPDGYVAWASDAVDDAATARARQAALWHWCGDYARVRGAR